MRTPAERPATARRWWLLLAVVLLSRLPTMAALPLTDTTEARYGAIARLMAVTGDRVTPWFAPGVPFWGKPPLAFWAQALSFQWLGGNELALRLPSWLACLAMVALVARYGRSLIGDHGGWVAALIAASSGLLFVCAGAVLTDSFLALGTTAALVGAGQALRGERRAWGALFFAGLVVGLLAKGPLALVLVGAPLFLWALWSGRWADLWRRLPWWRGGVVTLLLAVPWYLLAEHKTPGFLRYFIVGEHFQRFLDPGWGGDRYGSAHDRARGTIWLLTLYAAFPWSLWALALLPRLRDADGRRRLRRALKDDDNRLLIAAAFVPGLFFTFSGNILATYVLPGLPFMALLLARALGPRGRAWRRIVGAAMLVPVLSLIAGAYVLIHPDTLRTEKALVACYQRQPEADRAPLIYLEEVPFSARYYGRETPRARSLAQAREALTGSPRRPLYLAVRPRELDALERPPAPPLVELARNRRYRLMTTARDIAACP
ncbi:ArnT family glycosyltransferase [Alloalcanivorax marinus]|uniref:ArnT family glycosyltransferase n=1 Tax=Alloalcanivorax marinus TaxID=1177169 RepID=UPI001957E67E|nr:glycosyltransferase family 39 protein [Alloalcanivorax marinus]MBM7333078.1 glycosyltransferase family 39 protein [Alloalcanivorax marinus]